MFCSFLGNCRLPETWIVSTKSPFAVGDLSDVLFHFQASSVLLSKCSTILLPAGEGCSFVSRLPK